MNFMHKKLESGLLDEVRSLVIEGLISYQPFVFSDDLEVGVGYEFEVGRYAGLVHYPEMPEPYRSSPELARRLLPEGEKNEFRAANQRLAGFYDYLAGEIATGIGGAQGNSFLDVGCNNGYMPISFNKRGATVAAGCDRQDFSRVFRVLNKVAGSDARFIHAWYDPLRHCIEGVEAFDVVTSMAMLCHVSDPLHLLSSLGKLARKALFVWSLFCDDPSYLVRYGEPRGDYPGDAFPYCFDNMTVPSTALIKRSLELMGFAKVTEVAVPDSCRTYSWNGVPFRGFFATR